MSDYISNSDISNYNLVISDINNLKMTVIISCLFSNFRYF